MAEDTLPKVIRAEQGLTLVPDPSVLTREMLARESENTRALLRGEFEGQIRAIHAQLDGMNKAVEVFSDNLTRVPTDVDKQVGNLDRLTVEKFATVREMLHAVDQKFMGMFSGVELRFTERDTRFSEAALSRDTAVAAALQAAKEAVAERNTSFALSIDKSEKATGEQITQQRALLDTTTKALSDKIDDLRERMTRIEGLGLGRIEATTDQRQSWGVAIAALGILVAVAAVLVSVALR